MVCRILQHKQLKRAVLHKLDLNKKLNLHHNIVVFSKFQSFESPFLRI